MGGTTRRKLRSQIICERIPDEESEGTSARTRPLSYDEIMVKRKSKKELGGFGEEAREAEITRHEETVRKPDRQSRDPNGHLQSRDPNSDRQRRFTNGDQSRDANVGRQSRDANVGRQSRDANVGRHSRDVNGAAWKNSREHLRETSPKKMVDKSSRTEHTHSKIANKERRDMESRSTQKHDNDVRNATESKSHKEGRKSKVDEVSRGNKERRDMESRSTQKHDNDVKNATESKSHKDGRKSKADHVSRGDARYNDENKHRRDSSAQDRYIERNAGASERESKRKDRSGDDEKYRMRDLVKKHDSGSRRDSEILGKEKTESTRSHHDETRSKKRRSTSPERMKDKTRRSSSFSPKTRKNVSHHSHDHSEPSSRSETERSRRHPDIDRSKVPGEGSSSNKRGHGVSSSGLGGYSPRKRKSEAAIKTPSPIRSPERKSVGWDLAPSGADKNLTTAVGTQLVSQTMPSNMIELAAGFSAASNVGKPISAILSNNLSAFKQASMDSVQLTQATRPMRRLYIDNIPDSATEKDIMECFNTFLFYSGSNHIRGTSPCISCMVHKEKGQALVEFLTPEDATAALSFDGRSLCGSILKIRRPKDYVEMRQVPSETSEKTETGGDSTSDVSITDFVKDSPHKIFVGGIAKGLSSEMIMEIVSAFGTLKAYRFEVNEDVGEPCAFLEFADPSVTLKACAGLNGMKLGGRVLTVAQAFPDTETVESSRSHPFYGIPDHVKPLLQMPTHVLKLTNVLDKKAMDSLSETDLEEVLDDVRLECSRFGSVVSINVVRGGDTHAPISESNEVAYNVQSVQLPENKNHLFNMIPVEGDMYIKDGDVSNGELLTNMKEFDAGESVVGRNDELAPTTTNPSIEVAPSERSPVEESKETDGTSAQSCGKDGDDPQGLGNLTGVLTVDDVGRVSDSEGTHQPTSFKEIGVSSELNSHESRSIKLKDSAILHADDDVLELDENNGELPKVESPPSNSGALEKGLGFENSFDKRKVFEVGCVLVEFKRTEASCIAAHCLHGRAFDNRAVSVEYAPLEAYREVFSK